MIVPVPQFTAPSYLMQNDIATQVCRNLIPCQTPDGWVLYGSPGLTLLGTSANNAGCRGIGVSPGGFIYSVNGNRLYKILTNGTFTNLQTINTSSGTVWFANNSTHMVMVDGANGWSIALSNDAVTQITDANFPTSPLGLAFYDGRFVTMNDSTATFYLSELNSSTDWTPSTFATAESSGDLGWGPIRVGDKVLMFGYGSIEPWYNTGNPSFPWERVTGGVIPFGTPYFHFTAELNGTVYFISQGSGGLGSVWAYGDGGLRKISTPVIESAVSLWTFQNGYGFAYAYKGKAFYEIVCTDGNAISPCWVYNATDNTWFQRDTGGSAHTVRAIVDANRVYYALDRSNGNVYTYGTANSDNGTAITRVRTFGPIESGTKRVFHSQIRFEFEMKADAAGTTSIAPTLEWSDDGGLTFSTAITMTKSVTSTTTSQRVTLVANRLGSSQCRYYRLTLTGAAKYVLKKCELDLKEGRF